MTPSDLPLLDETVEQSKNSSVKSQKGSTKSSFSKESLLNFYNDMLLIRRFEERAGQLYGMGLIGGFCHLYIGQEAVVVGLQANVNDKDSIITT